MPVRGPDTRIPLMGQPVQMPDVLGTMGKVAQIKRLEAISQQEQQEMALKQKALEDDEAVKAIFATPGMTMAKAIPLLYAKDPRRAQIVEKAWLDRQNTEASLQGHQLDNAKKTKAQQEDDFFTATMEKYHGFTPEAEAVLMAKIPERTVAYKQLLQKNQTTKGVDIGGFLSAAPTIDVARSYLEKVRGTANPADIAYYEGIMASAPDWATAQQQMTQSAMSADQRSQAQNRTVDDTRAAEQFAETKRHNQATEAAARATNARLSQTESGGLKPGDTQTVEAIIKNPGLYAGLTPSTKERLIPALMEKGFTGFASGQAGKPSTGLQKKALGYFTRAKQAAEEIEQLQESGMGLGEQTYAEYAPNFAQTQKGQAYNAAQRAFTEARLRKDSGAAIPQQEFDSDRNTYFRKPGDSDATLAQKKRGRAAMLAALAFEAGPALHEFYGDDADEMLASYKAAQRIGADVKNATARSVGDEVMVNGQKVKITKILANGKFEGDVVR